MFVNISGHDAALVVHQGRHMGGLAAGCTAAVDDQLTGLRIHHMGYEHGAFILHLAKPLLQRRQLIQRTMRGDPHAFGRPLALLHFGTSLLQSLHQFCTACFQRIGAHRKHGLAIIKVAELFRLFIAELLHPTLDEPIRMLASERQSFRGLALAFGELRLLRLPHRRTQDRIDKFHRTCMAVLLGQLHRRIAGRRGGHLVQIENLVEP